VELLQDVKIVQEYLIALQGAVLAAPRGHANLQNPPAPLVLSQILASFKGTIEECWTLLNKRDPHGGPASNLRWHFLDEDEVHRLRDRLSYLNIKVRRFPSACDEEDTMLNVFQLSVALNSWNL
jgi:hypothetical protein